MTVPFGPQLIGQTEKTLNTILDRALAGTGLTEPQWVTLRLARQLDPGAGADDLVAAVADRARFADAHDLVAALTDRGILADGHLTAAGRALVDGAQASVDVEVAAIFGDLPAQDVAVATRVLNEVLQRARARGR